MRTYELIFENYSEEKRKNKIVKKISFPEAASEAYMTINRLGFKWRVKSVKEVENKNAKTS